MISLLNLYGCNVISPPLQINFFIILPVIALFSSQFLSLHPEGQEYIRICYLDNLDTKFSVVSKKTNKYKTEDAICVKNSTQVTITTWPANAPIKRMKFVLNRILSQTQAISIVFLRRERQINTQKTKQTKTKFLES